MKKKPQLRSFTITEFCETGPHGSQPLSSRRSPTNQNSSSLSIHHHTQTHGFNFPSNGTQTRSPHIPCLSHPSISTQNHSSPCQNARPTCPMRFPTSSIPANYRTIRHPYATHTTRRMLIILRPCLLTFARGPNDISHPGNFHSSPSNKLFHNCFLIDHSNILSETKCSKSSP